MGGLLVRSRAEFWGGLLMKDTKGESMEQKACEATDKYQ